MKKSLLVSLILLSGVLLTACGNKDEKSTENVEPTKVVEISECEKAVQKYLDWADKKWEWEEIKAWDNIVVDYIWRLEDWTVFDTSVESVAKACWKYMEWRDYMQGLSFEVWAWQMIKWFDEWVVWMKVWQTKTVQFWPEKGYGQRREDYVMTYSAEEVWDLTKFTQGQRIYLWIWAAALITEVTDKSITLDLNHELAWKTLIFDITIKSIN